MEKLIVKDRKEETVLIKKNECLGSLTAWVHFLVAKNPAFYNWLDLSKTLGPTGGKKPLPGCSA